MDFFLQRAPHVVSDFQQLRFLLKQRHEVMSLKASPLEFWKLLDKSSLVEVGFLDTQVVLVQRELLAQRSVPRIRAGCSF